ncbi:sensor histidine kinase [Paenibacillus macerans]|uniref:sensor histidine kinase n=1 Tax=Paenibacillus macerans TaxID=44252 RepID=UPI00203DD1D2|nr:histidine kinase [Paenibacillus macerans]MCM3698249.1 histidine kinase [Paenibacillus macerans]
MKRFFADRPIQSKLLISFLPILVLSVAMTGWFSYLSVAGKLQQTTYYSLSDLVQQTSLFLDDKFATVFEQLVSIEDHPSFRSILAGEGQGYEQRRYDDIIGLHDRFEEIYHTFFQMIDSIYVGFNNGRSFNLQKEFVPRRVSADLADWVGEYQQAERGYYWLNSHQDGVFDTVESRKVLSNFKIIGTPSSEVSGLILINLRESYFRDIMENVKISPSGTLALISPDGTLFSKPLDERYEVAEETIAKLRSLAGERGSLTARSLKGEKLTIAYDTLPLNQWVLAAIVPERDILAGVHSIKYISFGITLIVLLVFVVVAAWVARKLTDPIRYLSKQVRRFEQGNLQVNFQLNERNEIGVLANGLASLSETVGQLLQEVRDKERQKRRIELHALQAQIQPHFLYNTLCSIKHLIDLREKEKASEMVAALTRFFRIGISKGKEVIPIGEEIEHVRSYLQILHLRYSKDFEFRIDVADELLTLSIPKLTLQPLVENAIYHGIKTKRGRGIISITGRRMGDKAILEVYDNGSGIAPDKLVRLAGSIRADRIDEAEEPITYGLRNCHRRLALHFGAPYGLNLESVHGEYTRVTVELPFTEKGEEYDSEAADC